MPQAKQRKPGGFPTRLLYQGKPESLSSELGAHWGPRSTAAASKEQRVDKFLARLRRVVCRIRKCQACSAEGPFEWLVALRRPGRDPMPCRRGLGPRNPLGRPRRSLLGSKPCCARIVADTRAWSNGWSGRARDPRQPCIARLNRGRPGMATLISSTILPSSVLLPVDCAAFIHVPVVSDCFQKQANASIFVVTIDCQTLTRHVIVYCAHTLLRATPAGSD